MKDQRLNIGILKEVVQLFIQIAIVDVDRHAADFHGGKIGFGIFRRVVEIHAHFGVMAQTCINQTLCETRGAIFIVVPGYSPFTLNQRDVLGHRIGDGFPNQRKM